MTIPTPRPLDHLSEALGKTVLVKLKSGEEIRGELESFDNHMNLILGNAEEIEGTQPLRKLGKTLLRGDTILFISP